MVVSIITVKLYASWIHSLKDKRTIVRSLIEKLRNKYNVSVIESDAQDIHQTIVISVAFLAGNSALAHSMSEKICAFIEANTDAEMVEVQEEYL